MGVLEEGACWSWGGGHVLIEAAMFWLAYCMGHHDACGGAEA